MWGCGWHCCICTIHACSSSLSALHKARGDGRTGAAQLTSLQLTWVQSSGCSTAAGLTEGVLSPPPLPLMQAAVHRPPSQYWGPLSPKQDPLLQPGLLGVWGGGGAEGGPPPSQPCEVNTHTGTPWRPREGGPGAKGSPAAAPLPPPDLVVPQPKPPPPPIRTLQTHKPHRKGLRAAAPLRAALNSLPLPGSPPSSPTLHPPPPAPHPPTCLLLLLLLRCG